MAEKIETMEARYQKLSKEVERLLGRRDEAVRSLDSLKTSCVSKGIDPENLQAHIDSAQKDLDDATADLQSDLLRAEQELQDILTKLKDLT